MSLTLGEKLRQAREERGISISEVAEQTRISSLYLKSIEDDNYKPLPGGIFNKGFVKAYAKYVGLDEQEALQDYARLIAKNEDSDELDQHRYRPEVLTDEARTASSMVPTIVFAVIILALMTGGLLFFVNYFLNQPDTPAVVNNSSSDLNTASNLDPSNTDSNSTATVPEQIQLEFKALSEKVSVTSTVDGNLAYDEVLPDTPKTFTAEQGLKLRYYRGFADKVQLTLNGRQLEAPAPPARGNIEFEINKDNVARIYQSGTISEDPVEPVNRSTSRPAPAVTMSTTPAATPQQTGTARPTPTARPAITQQSTPRRSPTPIIVGRSPSPRPSPE